MKHDNPYRAEEGEASQPSRESLIEAWRTAGRELRIRVTAPFVFSTATETYNCIAFLPDFGGQAGMVIDAIKPPDFRPQGRVCQGAERAGYYLSLINMEVYWRFDAEVFKEALREWHYFGPDTDGPDWFMAPG